MGWNPAVGQRVRIVSPGARLPADKMTGRVAGSWMWERGNVRPFRVYEIVLDRPYGVMRRFGVTRDALVFVARSPQRKKTATTDSTRPRRRA